MTTYYTILGIAVGSDSRTIANAYRMMRRRTWDPNVSMDAVEKAFEVLKTPNLRQRYDAMLNTGAVSVDRRSGACVYEHREKRGKSARIGAKPAARKGAKPQDSTRSATLALGVAIAGLVFVILFILWPKIEWRYTVHALGTQLESKRSGELYGEVLAFEKTHRYTNGRTGQAYRIVLPDGRKEWIPKNDINQLTRPRSP